MRIPLADGHAHSNPVSGMGARRIAERFRRAGGWFMALVSLPPWHYGIEPRSAEDYARSFQVHVRECREAREAGLRVACVAGMHPAEVDKLVSKGFSVEKVLELGEKVVKILEGLLKRGEIDGLGEVGRPHYRTSPERVAVAEYIMTLALEVARDYGCVVHLHLENAGPATAVTADKAVELVGLRGPAKKKVIMHHSSVRVAQEAIARGLTPTVLGRVEQLREAFKRLPPEFMVESDFLDDPKRPCVAACPWDAAEAQLALLEEGVVPEEYLYKINVDLVRRVYGVEPP